MLNRKELVSNKHKEFKALATICALCGIGVVAHHSLNVHANSTTMPTTAAAPTANVHPQASTPAASPTPQPRQQPVQQTPVQNRVQAPIQRQQPAISNNVLHQTTGQQMQEPHVQQPVVNGNTGENSEHQPISSQPQAVIHQASVTHNSYTNTAVSPANQSNIQANQASNSSLYARQFQATNYVDSANVVHSATSQSNMPNASKGTTLDTRNTVIPQSKMNVRNSSSTAHIFKPLDLRKIPTNKTFYFKQSPKAPLVSAHPVINIAHVLGKTDEPKVLLGTTRLLGSTAPGGFPHDIEVTDYSQSVFAKDPYDYGTTGPQDGPDMYVPSMTADVTNSGIFCNNYNELGPQHGMKHRYVATTEASQKMTDALGYAYKHNLDNNAKALIVWATETGNTADQIKLSHVSGDAADVAAARRALKSPNGAADAQALGLSVQNYRAGGGRGGNIEQDVTVVKTNVHPTKTTTIPPSNNTNTNTPNCGGGGSSSSSGGSSSSSTGGSPSGNGNQQQGGNGNGTNGGGNGTESTGNGNNGGGNGSPANNPNNSNNPNNGQPNNSNPNNANANNTTNSTTSGDGDSGGSSSNNNNNIVPSGAVINNNDAGNGNNVIGYNNDYSDLLAALVNNEDRDNQDALNRLNTEALAKASNMSSMAAANASESAANLAIAEKGKNAMQIQSMNASASVQAITNSMATDSAMKSLSNSASIAQSSYMDSLNDADAAANSDAQDAIDIVDHMPNLNKQQRDEAFNEIQSGENSFAAAATFGSAAAPTTNLNAELKHIEAIIELENQKAHSPASSVPTASNNSSKIQPTFVAPVNNVHGNTNNNNANIPSIQNQSGISGYYEPYDPLAEMLNYVPVSPDKLFSSDTNVNTNQQPSDTDIPISNRNKHKVHEQETMSPSVSRTSQRREYRAGYRAGSRKRADRMMMVSSPEYRMGYQVFQTGYSSGLTGDYTAASNYTGQMLNDFNNAYSAGVAASGNVSVPSDDNAMSTSSDINGASDIPSDMSASSNDSDVSSDETSVNMPSGTGSDNQSTLPQTGDNDNTAKVLGAVSLGLGSALLAGDELRKRKYRHEAK